MTKRRRLVFALGAVAMAVVVTTAALAAVDVFLHGRYEKSAGYNIWGYRGPAAPKKAPGELRIAMLGGSAAYGYGVTWDEAIPAQLERILLSRPGVAPVSVINLGYNNEGAYSFRFTLDDYRWLDYDLALLYEGYNDVVLNPPEANLQVFRHESPVFRLTGYLPIFPIIFREKAGALLTGGEVASADDPAHKTVFRPGLSARATAGMLTAAASVGQALERQLEGATNAPDRTIPDDASTGCAFPWTLYCRSVLIAVELALSHGKAVIVAGQPHFPPNTARSARHLQQQAALADMIQRKFAAHPRVEYIATGTVVDLGDPAMSFDQMHLTAPGNRLVAAALAGPASEMVQVLRTQVNR